MALPTVSTFKSQLANSGGSARPNLFKVSIKSVKTTQSLDSDQEFLVKATQIPASTIAEAPLNYGGRVIKYAGFRTYANWTTTIINDEEFAIRNKIQNWMRRISGALDGKRSVSFGRYADANGQYNEGTGTITQVNKDGRDGESYTVNNIWPTSIASMALDWSTDGFMEYSVEWCFDTWTHN